MKHEDSDLSHEISRLVNAIHSLVEQKNIEFEWFKPHGEPATRHDLKRLEEKLDHMLKEITDFAAAQNAANDRVDAALTAIELAIAALKAGAGTLSTEDAAALAALQARQETLATRTEALAASAATPSTP